jgi:hypothetical protein
MRTFLLIAVIAAFATPAYAQFGDKPGGKAEQEKAEQAKQRAREDEAYKKSLTRIPDREREQKSDPWGGVRPGSTK